MTDIRHSHDEMRVPRPALYGAALMIAFAFAAAISGRMGWIERVAVPQAPVAEQRDFRFVQHEDKSITVIDLAVGREAGTIAAEEAGFVNGVLRGLKHDRRVSGVAPDAPYTLVRTTAGRLALLDPSTGRRVELLGFGDENYDAFRRLMTLGRED